MKKRQNYSISDQQVEATRQQTAAAANQAATSAAAAAASAAIVSTDISYIKRDISEIKQSVKDLSGQYVTKTEFEPVKRIVYGIMGVLGLATMGAILRLILIK